jgi:hypothetical protein
MEGMEITVNRSPARIVLSSVLFLALAGGLFAITPIQSEFPAWLGYGCAGVSAVIAIAQILELFRLNTPIAILSPAGLFAPVYSDSVVPWEKVRHVERELDEDGRGVTGLRFLLDPEFERGMKRNRNLKANARLDGILVSTSTADTDADSLAAYCHAMMHPKKDGNV